MSPFELRTRIHTLIDAVKRDELLQRIHDLLAGSGEAKGTGVWASMTEAQRERVMMAYSSSLDPRNLSPTKDVLKRRKG